MSLITCTFSCSLIVISVAHDSQAGARDHATKQVKWVLESSSASVGTQQRPYGFRFSPRAAQSAALSQSHRAEAAGVAHRVVAFEQLQQLLVRAPSLSLRNRGAEASRTLRQGQL